MKRYLRFLIASAALHAACHGQDLPGQSRPDGPPINIRMELQVVSLPEDKAVPLVAELSKKETIEAAYAKIQDMLATKVAKLIGWPILTTKNGQRAVVEGINELRYATEYAAPVVAVTSYTEPTEADQKIKAKVNTTQLEGVPDSFQTRNVGVTLEAEPVLSDDGKRITISLVPQHVRLKGFSKITIEKPSTGAKVIVEQPEFDVMKITTTLTVQNGQRTLLGVYRTSEPADHLEFFIMKVEAIRVE